MWQTSKKGGSKLADSTVAIITPPMSLQVIFTSINRTWRNLCSFKVKRELIISIDVAINLMLVKRPSLYHNWGYARKSLVSLKYFVRITYITVLSDLRIIWKLEMFNTKSYDLLNAALSTNGTSGYGGSKRYLVASVT